jgi:hypothetical protein
MGDSIQNQQISDATFSSKYGPPINWLVTYDRADTFLDALGSSVVSSGYTAIHHGFMAGWTYHMLNSCVSRQGHAWRKDGCFQENKERSLCPTLPTSILSMNRTLS